MKEAKKEIRAFLNKNKNKVVRFANCDEKEKYAYVLVKSMNYFRDFLKADEALARAVQNAESHKKSNYEYFDFSGNETMRVA